MTIIKLQRYNSLTGKYYKRRFTPSLQNYQTNIFMCTDAKNAASFLHSGFDF